MPKTLEIQELSTLIIAGDERIELPPKVLETPIIPFDQSPIFNFKVCTLKTTHIISYFFELCKYFFQFPITL